MQETAISLVVMGRNIVVEFEFICDAVYIF